MPTNLIRMVGCSQKSHNCARTTMKDAQQITCQSSLMCTRDPEAWTTIHQQETMTRHPHAVADHGRKTTSNGDGPTRSHPTNSPTSLPRFESGKQMHGPFQNHERDVRTSPRLRPSTDCDPEGRQKCDVLQTMRDVWELVVAHFPGPWWNGTQR